MERWTSSVQVARLGPEPLEIGFEEFRQSLKRRTRMKALLLNQAFLAGLGNIYADEFIRRRDSSLAIAARLSDPRAERLHRAIREILQSAIAAGRSSISDYVDALGEKGWFQVQHLGLWTRRRALVTQCGAPIKKILVAQRGTHFCPCCQKR